MGGRGGGKGGGEDGRAASTPLLSPDIAAAGRRLPATTAAWRDQGHVTARDGRLAIGCDSSVCRRPPIAPRYPPARSSIGTKTPIGRTIPLRTAFCSTAIATTIPTTTTAIVTTIVTAFATTTRARQGQCAPPLPSLPLFHPHASFLVYPLSPSDGQVSTTTSHRWFGRCQRSPPSAHFPPLHLHYTSLQPCDPCRRTPKGGGPVAAVMVTPSSPLPRSWPWGWPPPPLAPPPLLFHQASLIGRRRRHHPHHHHG